MPSLFIITFSIGLDFGCLGVIRNIQNFQKMDFRSKSIYECEHPVLLRSVSVPFSDRKTIGLRSRICIDRSTGEIGKELYRDLINVDNRQIPLIVRCGKCDHCRKYQNDEWSTRMIMEQIGSDAVCFFATLSFGESHYKKVASVEKTQVYRDFVVPFKKRLRSYGLKFRFFCVSELGEQFGRFHFHILLFVLKSELVTLSALAKGYCDKYASLSLHYNESIRLYVKGSDGHFRLQTDLEVYIQNLIQRAWSDNRQRFYIKPDIHFTVKKNGRKVKSVSYPNQIGWVSCTQCESFGAVKYVTSYAQKCLHDGIVTYHRQSPALGKCYVDNNIRGSKTMLESGQSNEDFWTFGTIPTVLPRYFIRKFMPDQKRYDRFWKYYNSIPKTDFVALLPKQIDSWDTSSFMLAQQIKMLEKPIENIGVQDFAWLDTLDYVNDQLLSGVAKKFTHSQIQKIYKRKLKELCITTLKKTDPNTSVPQTLF